MKFSKISVCLLTASVLLGASAFAKDGDMVGRVRIVSRGEQKVDESFVRSFISVNEGEKVSREGIARDVRSILDTKRFSYVSVSTEEIESGKTDVIFTLEQRFKLASKVSFSGLHGISTSRAQKTIGLKPGDFIDEQIAASGAEKLRKLYNQRRYFGAEVKYTLAKQAEAPGSVFLSYQITEGARCKVDFLSFPGATVIPESKLGAFACIHDWYNPQSWVINKRVTNEDLDIVASDARRQYLEAGYLDVEISDPIKTFDGNKLKVKYNVNEGAQYRIGSIELEGVSIFTPQEIMQSIPARTGAVAGIKLLELMRSSVRDYYGSRGYLETRVEPHYQYVGTVVNVKYTVREGALKKIRNIHILGNTSTKDKVIRREIGLNPGEPMDTVQAERSRRRLMNLGYFEDVRQYDTDVGNDQRDVFYEVDEQSTGHLTFGLGFSSIDHLVGIFGIEQSNFDIFNWHNFRGGGQKARLDATIAKNSDEVNLSFVEPWFLDRRLALNVDAFLTEHDFDEYDVRKLGFRVGLEKMVPWVGRVGLSYGLSANKLSDQYTDEMFLLDNPDRIYHYSDEDDNYLIGDMRLSWTYDTRDQPIVPTTGTRATAYFRVANAAFGSDYDFYEANIKAFKYFQLPFGTHLVLSGRMASIDGMGGDDVPIDERYFLGGGRFVRGFKHRHIGPKAVYKKFPDDFGAIGGQSLLWGSAEFSINLAPRIRIAAFYDIGNVWEDAWDFDMSEYAASAGIGLRFDFVGFPLRFDYAHALDKDDDMTRKREFVFWIGFDN